MPTSYSGGCQCGAVRYDVTADIGEVMACNCSRCGKLGTLLTFVPSNAFHLKKGDAGAMSEYLFNKHNIHHLFCKTCGIQSFARGKGRDGAEMIAINGGGLDNVEPASSKEK